MSRRVATLVYERRAGSSARKAVLAYFADRADDYGRGIFASKQTIADETELGRSTVIRVVNEFVAEGILIVAGSKPCRNGSTVLYDMDLAKIRDLPAVKNDEYPSQSGTSPDRDPSQSGTSPDRDPSQSGTPPVPERDPMGSQSGTQTVPEPSLNQEDANASLSLTPDHQPIDEVAEAVLTYRAAAERQGWPIPQQLDQTRRRAISARLKASGGPDGWRTAIEKAAASPFLGAARPFSGFGIDWIAKPANFKKIMEGNYDDRQSPQQNRHTAADDRFGRIADAAVRNRAPSRPDFGFG